MNRGSAKVIPFCPRPDSAAEFDRLTVRLVMAKYRAGTLPAAVIEALLVGVGLGYDPRRLRRTGRHP